VDILDRLTEGAEKVAKEAEKVFEQGKRKVGELQTERQMDVVARRLGYLEYETHRGRVSDPAKRDELLAELARLEEEQKTREEAAAAAREAEKAAEGRTAGGDDIPTGVEDSGLDPIEREEREMYGEDQRDGA
jgi:hypothetical protein